MNTRILVIAGAVAALAAPAAATAKTIPIKPAGKQPAAKKTAVKQTSKVVVKATSEPRRLCICIVNPPWVPVPVMSQEEFERQYDEDMIAHGLEPVYGTTAAANPAAAG
jgi:hypothetical protein